MPNQNYYDRQNAELLKMARALPSTYATKDMYRPNKGLHPRFAGSLQEYRSRPSGNFQNKNQSALAVLDDVIANLEKHAPKLTPRELDAAQRRERAEAKSINEQAFYQNSRFGPRLGGKW